MSDTSSTPSARVGTVGGTLLILIANLSTADIIKTITMAAVGAAVSFIVSFALKELVKKCRKRTPE